MIDLILDSGLNPYMNEAPLSEQERAARGEGFGEPVGKGLFFGFLPKC